jgi:hypothetical protein
LLNGLAGSGLPFYGQSNEQRAKALAIYMWRDAYSSMPIIGQFSETSQSWCHRSLGANHSDSQRGRLQDKSCMVQSEKVAKATGSMSLSQV